MNHAEPDLLPGVTGAELQAGSGLETVPGAERVFRGALPGSNSRLGELTYKNTRSCSNCASFRPRRGSVRHGTSFPSRRGIFTLGSAALTLTLRRHPKHPSQFA